MNSYATVPFFSIHVPTLTSPPVFQSAVLLPAASAPLSVLMPQDTTGLLARLRSADADDVALARVINGTAHTAFLKDMRLARKVVSVAQDEAAARRFPEIPEERRRQVLAVIRSFLASGEDVSEGFLKSLLEAAGTEASRSLKRSWDAGDFAVKLVDDRTLEKHAGRKGRELSGFVTLKDRDRPLILLKSPKIPSQGGRMQAPQFRILLSLLFTLFHEWDHKCQFLESVRPGEIAELLAHLEEHRLRIQIGDREISRLASEQGLTVAQFLLAKIREAAPSRFERFLRFIGFR